MIGPCENPTCKLQFDLEFSRCPSCKTPRGSENADSTGELDEKFVKRGRFALLLCFSGHGAFAVVACYAAVLKRGPVGALCGGVGLLALLMTFLSVYKGTPGPRRLLVLLILVSLVVLGALASPTSIRSMVNTLLAGGLLGIYLAVLTQMDSVKQFFRWQEEQSKR